MNPGISEPPLKDTRPLAPLIAIEGIDGSGKGTQAALLLQRLCDSGYLSQLISFPRYQATFFGARVGEFLNGDFGALSDLHPFLISLLYAGDRFESRQTLCQARADSQAVIFDRYVASNIAHQCAKVPAAERDRLQGWIEHVEYTLYELPRPQQVILLDISVEHSQELIHRKQQRTYTELATDLQEADQSYLQAVRDVYLHLAHSSPDWQIISVTGDNGQVRLLEDVAEEIWQAVQPVLGSGAGAGAAARQERR